MQHASTIHETVTSHDAKILKRIRKISRLMDEAFTIPVINKKIGFDGIIGLVPGIGDAFGSMFTAYIIAQAVKLNVPNEIVTKMIYNLLIDMAVGSIPVVGDLFDVAYKANIRNLNLLEEYLATRRTA